MTLTTNGKLHPKRCGIALDAMVLDRDGSARDVLVDRLLALEEEGTLHFVQPGTAYRQTQDPRTPTHVRERMSGQIHTLPTSLTSKEEDLRRRVLEVMRGNSTTDRHDADAAILFEAAKHACGYVITEDKNPGQEGAAPRDNRSSHLHRHAGRVLAHPTTCSSRKNGSGRSCWLFFAAASRGSSGTMQQDAAEELLKIADEASDARRQINVDEIQGPIRALHDVCEEVKRAWSGSNIGYHATVYFEDLRPTPPGVQFSPEWGLMDNWPTHQPNPGWRMWDFKDVLDQIYARADGFEPDVLVGRLAPLRVRFDDLQEAAKSVLDAVLLDTKDTFLERKLKDIEQLVAPDASTIAPTLVSKGAGWSRRFEGDVSRAANGSASASCRAPPFWLGLDAGH